eukprot:1014640_1
MSSMKALVGHHVSRKFEVNIDFNKRRKFIKITVTDEMNDDEFEEIYNDTAFGKYELRNVYETFNAAMEIGTPNVFNVFEEDGLCKIQIAKEKDMELPPFILRPISGPCVEKYQKIRRQQRRAKQLQKMGGNNDVMSDEENDSKEEPKVFKNKMPLAKPKP